MTILSRRSVVGGLVVALVASSSTAASISYEVPGIVEPITQASSMTCWATVATSLHGWKHSQSTTIEKVLEQAGSSYLSKFRSNEGLAAAEKPTFLSTMGLRSKGPRNYTIAGWEGLLRAHGPLWVTTAEGNGFSIHARILTGIVGDGSANGTIFTIVDPADGARHHETVTVFVAKFEEVARLDLGAGADLRPQVVHY